MYYPIGMVFDEAQIVVERLNGLEATRAVLTQMAVSALLSKEGGKAFSTKIKELTGSDGPSAPKKTGKDLMEKLKRDG